jgi:hypothetical protein
VLYLDLRGSSVGNFDLLFLVYRGSRVSYLYYFIWTSEGVVFGNFNCIIFGLWDSCFVLLTVLCFVLLTIIFGLEGNPCFVLRLYYIWTLGVVFLTLYYIWTLGVVFRTFDCIMFGLEWEPCFVLCIIFGLWELCFLLLTVLYLNLRGSHVFLL